MSRKPYYQLLEDRGVSLEQLGLHELALRREDALAAIDLLEAAERPILGGDVFFIQGERVELAYANWSTSSKASESVSDYVARCCRDSRKYITDFPHYEDRTPIFVLVAA